MELNYDWKSFQNFFYSKKRNSQTNPQPNAGNGNASAGASLSAGASAHEDAPIYLVADGRVVVSAFSETGELAEWIGATSDEVAAEFSGRQVVKFDRSKVDEWMNSSTGLSHFYDQIQFLRTQAKPEIVGKGKKSRASEGVFKKHFLLEAVQGWWQKLLPSHYGVYIRLEGSQGLSLLLLVKRGRLDSFYIPDLSSMIPERRQYSADVVRFLEERYLVPVQGVFLTVEEWADWSESPNPWRSIVTAVKAQRSKLVPFNWVVAGLVFLRGYFGF